VDPHLHLHNQLLSGDPAALERLVAECGAALERTLHRRHIALPRDMVRDAANDAFLAVVAKPAAFDPQKGSLLNFLVHIADHKLADRLRARSRMLVRETPVGGAAELERLESAGSAVLFYASQTPARELDDLPPEISTWLSDTLPDPRDRKLLSMICDGRQSVEDFAAILGIEHLALPEQRAAVKRHRDRILRRLRYRREELRSLYHG